MESEKLPVFGTVGLALRWGLFVVLRHWWIILIFAIPLVALSYATLAVVEQGQLPSLRFSLLSLAQWVLLDVLSIVLALLTHNEVLRGTAGLNAQTLGWGAVRVVAYFLDSLMLTLFGLLVMLLLVGTVGGMFSLFRQFVAPHAPDALIIVLMIGAWLTTVLIALRLMLRLPSRALGQPIPWREAWRLARGNSVRLFGAIGLLLLAMIGMALPVLAIVYLASMLGLAGPSQETLAVTAKVPIQGQWSFMANQTISVPGGSTFTLWGALLALLNYFTALAGSVFFFALLSVAYAELNLIAERRARRRAYSRIHPDPNEPPEDF